MNFLSAAQETCGGEQLATSCTAAPPGKLTGNLPACGEWWLVAVSLECFCEVVAGLALAQEPTSLTLQKNHSYPIISWNFALPTWVYTAKGIFGNWGAGPVPRAVEDFTTEDAPVAK